MTIKFKDFVVNSIDKLNMSDADFAEMLGTSVHTVWNWKLGKTLPHKALVPSIRGIVSAAIKSNKTKKTKNTERRVVVCQNWEESERGWGCRPDGFTLHLTEADRDKFVDNYYRKYNNEKITPDCYTRVCGTPYLTLVDSSLYKNIKDSTEHGIWGDGNSGPRELTAAQVNGNKKEKHQAQK